MISSGELFCEENDPESAYRGRFQSCNAMSILVFAWPVALLPADHVDWRAHLALFDPFRISTGFSWVCGKPSNCGAGQCLGLVFKIIGAWGTWQLGTSTGPSSSGAARRKTGLLRPNA